MASSVTRFEVELPDVDYGTAAFSAIQSFLTNMQSLTQIFSYQSNDTKTGLDYITVKGYLTPTQASAALAFLATLNSALGYNVYCVSMSAQSQP